MAVQMQADRQEIAELRNTTTALVQTVEIFQRNFEAIQRNFEANERKLDRMMTYITGLQVENRRILERVLGPDFDK